MFLGHRSDVAPNFKKPMPQYNNKKVLFNDNGQFSILNNICPHQGSLIISSMKESMSCQYHGWSWDNNGHPANSGNTVVCNSSRLSKKEAFETNSLIFSEKIDLSSVNHVDLSFMKLVEERTDLVESNYRNIIDVFLDVDHIPVVHPEVYTQVGVADQSEVEWAYYDWGNIQFVKKNGPLTKEYKDTLLGIDEEKLAAFWVTLYPYVTIDWQPGYLTVMSCVPDGENRTKAVIHQYRDTRYSDENWRINKNIWETAWMQDKHQAEVIVARSQSEQNLEEAKLHFRNWEENK